MSDDELRSILNERGRNYGPFSGHADATQSIKRACQRHLNKNERFDDLSYKDQAVVLEALDMIAHKIGRIVNGDPLFKDSWDDIAGYARLVPEHTGDKDA
jgi:hypothetical protein